MSAVVFDPLKFATLIHECDPSGQRSAVKHRSLRCVVQTLQEAGLDNRVAKAISVTVRDSREAADVVTKADSREMEVRLDAKIEALHAGFNLIKWMRGSLRVVMLSILVKRFF